MMRNSRIWTMLCGAGLVLAALPHAAADDLAINGSFELGPAIGPEGYTQVDAPSSAIDGWSVVAGSVDVVGGWTDADGARSIDMTGVAPGTIEQVFATSPGATYLVRFMLAGNPGASPTIKTLRVSAGDVEEQFDFDITGRTPTSMGWVERSISFVATDVATTLSFASLTAGNAGPAIDHVRIDLFAPANEPPVADAGPDQVVDEGALVQLDGTGSTDPEGAPLGYLWDVWDGMSVAFSDATSATPTFVAPSVAADTLIVLRLRVTDDHGDVASDFVEIGVRDLAASPPPDDTFCPRGHGYWKNHAEAWPVDSLVLGSTAFTKPQAIDVLKIAPQGDARLILARQLIAAKLNLAAGATDVETPGGDLVSQVVADADQALIDHGGVLFAKPFAVKTSSAPGQAMLALKDDLEAFNHDESTAGC